MSYGEPAKGALTPGSHAWTLNETDSQPFLRQALDLGINFFDTANVYSRGASEEVLGRFLKNNTQRDATVIATKVNGVMRDGPNGGGLSRKAIFTEIDASLRRLQTDYVDLYQIHRLDAETPIEETLEALDDVVKAGKARYIGASSMYAWQFAKAKASASYPGVRSRVDALPAPRKPKARSAWKPTSSANRCTAALRKRTTKSS